VTHVMQGSFVADFADAAAPTRRDLTVDAPSASAATSFRPAVRLDAISLSFGGVTALAEVELSVLPGEIRAIIGPNGAGKSSLNNVICGIYRPDHGRIWIGDKGFAQVPVERLSRLGVARTFQNLALFKGLSVLDNIMIGRASRSRSSFIEQIVGRGRARREREDACSRAMAISDFLALGAVRDRPVGTLPYGFQKRVELGRALIASPKILLLDEPMAGMTAAEKRDMSELLRAARDTFGTTVILIEHDIGVVMGLSDRVAVLDHGRKIADGTPSEVRRDQGVIDAYLGVAHDSDDDGAI
jgi:branched-chain amino acid transport system ATP-binding protein